MSPFKSKAQMKKLFSLESEGKLKPGTAEEFARATPNINKLPEKVAPKRLKIRRVRVIK